MAKTKKTAQTEAQVAETQVDDAASTPTTGEVNTTLEPVQLTVNDLTLLARVVDLASRRGAFQGAELTQVGAAYDKLTGFLAYVDSVQKTEASEETTEGATAE